MEGGGGGGSARPYPNKRTLCTGNFFCIPLVQTSEIVTGYYYIMHPTWRWSNLLIKHGAVVNDPHAFVGILCIFHRTTGVYILLASSDCWNDSDGIIPSIILYFFCKNKYLMDDLLTRCPGTRCTPLRWLNSCAVSKCYIYSTGWVKLLMLIWCIG